MAKGERRKRIQERGEPRHMWQLYNYVSTRRSAGGLTYLSLRECGGLMKRIHICLDQVQQLSAVDVSAVHLLGHQAATKCALAIGRA